MYSVAELVQITGQPYTTVRNQMVRGWCRWPKRERRGAVGAADPAYGCWENMVQRATNPKATGYQNYGGRGIKLDPLWQISFQSFILHIGPRPSPHHSIDRIDVDGHYEPGNVKWATPAEQAVNTRNLLVKRVAWNGQEKTAPEWETETGIPAREICRRLNRGWTTERTLTQLPRRSPTR